MSKWEMSPRLVAGIVVAALGLGCRTRPEAQSRDARQPEPTVAPAAVPAVADAAPVVAAPVAPPTPAEITDLAVPGDSTASVVLAANGSAPHTVFMPGLCSNAHAYLQSFPEAARGHGGIVAIDGDAPCGSLKGFHSFTWDAARQHARIQKALAAAGVTGTPPERITLVGYSQGAYLAEALVQGWPERYGRVVLIGAPTDPAAQHFRASPAVVTISCSRDVPGRMREAARRMTALGVPATYLEMPGCTHGNIADGERVFGEAFAWLDAH